ncbi:MAG: DUF5706 domain-containing protein [Gemmatimonadaceae bacterium]|nr:DUF5706 domain-containing protein [Gemmatimonadaceae bacterium]
MTNRARPRRSRAAVPAGSAGRPLKGLSLDEGLKVLQRFDAYVGTTHSRAPLVLTFNTFSVSAILIKWDELLAGFQGHSVYALLASGLLVIIAMASLVSLAFVFRVVTPYVAKRADRKAQRSKAAAGATSLFFFEDVAAVSVADLLQAMEDRDEADIRADVAAQMHALALSLRSKFSDLRWATLAILGVQLPAIAGLVALKLLVTL